MGAIEEWGVADPKPYLIVVLWAFGLDRCLAESNWFVSKAMGCSYDASFAKLNDALDAIGASDADRRAVFYENARRVYRI